MEGKIGKDEKGEIKQKDIRNLDEKKIAIMLQ